MDNTENPGREGNLKAIFGGPWSPSKNHARDNDPPEVQLADAIERAGLRRPDRILLDGKLHRFRTDTKGGPGGGDKPGWYIAFADGIPAGRFGCWRSGIELAWRAETRGRKLSAVEEMAITRRMAEAKAARDAELAASREITAETVDMIWSACAAADPAHPYLARKGIQPHGARVTGDGRLAVPLYDGPDQNVLTSLQYIEADGTKRYHAGGATGGSFWVIGDITATSKRIFIAEGFATAATIHEATGDPCVVAYSASNLVQVTGAMDRGQDIVIVADNDASGIGRKYADQASAKHGARVIIPPIEGDANDYLAGGHDLVALLNPPDEPDWLISADDFSSQPAPIEWLVKGWLQKRSLMMVHGPSGGGKTFAVLDWCLHLAAASTTTTTTTITTTTWNGKKLRPDGGPVIYLAGEGHHGLRSRIAAWKHRHDNPALNMWLSRAGCDLNTPEGYRRVADAISKTGGSSSCSPSLIVVDTLHRFLLGDENSAQDAKTMLDACAGLMEEFNCAVLLVHHTGVSEEAQHRARGSSAWRGALDIEISIVPADKENEKPMQIVQRKSKDAELAEPLYAELNSVEIPGWFDEDGDPVTSAVLQLVDAPPASTSGSEAGNGRMSKLDEARRTFERAWWAGGAQENSGGLPLVTRDALHDLLVGDGFAKRTADNHCRPSDRGRTIGILLNASLIRPDGNTAWVLIDQKHAAALLIRKSAD